MPQVIGIPAVPIADQRPPQYHYRIYVLVILLLVGICSWTDRQLFSILLQPIKQEFQLSDTLLGLLGGTAFGLFNVTVGLPVAWLADRSSRRTIVAAATALWSLMTAATGFATSYLTLFLCRMGVGIGEAGGSAPSQSLITDYFQPRHRAFAMGVLYSYVPIGYFISYALGGSLNDAVGWRHAFILFSLPGVVLALIVRLSIAEPPRVAGRASSAAEGAAAESLPQSIRYFLRHGSLRHIPLAGAAHGIGMFGAAVWMPAYMARTFHMSAAAVGLRLALVMGVCGMLGTLLGGRIVDRLVSRSRNAQWYSRACCFVLLCSLPFTISAFASATIGAALLFFSISMTLNHMILGPVVATMQNLAGQARRATAAAYYLFLVNLVSSALGPLLTGGLSDLLAARYNNDSLRYALLILMPSTCTWAALHFYRAGRSIVADLTDAEFSWV